MASCNAAGPRGRCGRGELGIAAADNWQGAADQGSWVLRWAASGCLQSAAPYLAAPGLSVHRVWTSARWLPFAVLVLVSTASPGLAWAAPAPPAADPWSQLAQHAADCLGREDPACAKLLLAEMEKDAPPGASSLDFWRGVIAFLDGQFGPAQQLLRKVASEAGGAPGLREQADNYADFAEATADILAPAKAHQLAGGKVIAWIRPGADEVLVAYLDTVLGRALPKLEEAFGPAGVPIALHVYPRADDLARVSGLTLQQIRTSGTIALCKHNRVMITSPQDLLFGYPWADTVVHELVHWFVIKRGGPRVPVWIHEGLARGLQGSWRGAALGELDRDELGVLATARKKGRFITLAKMHPSLAMLASQEDTQLAFAEVHYAVHWLLEHSGIRRGQPVEDIKAAGQMVALFGQGLDEAAVLQATTHLAPAPFQAAWRRDLARLDLHDNGEQTTKKVPLMFRSVSADGPQSGTAESRRYAELGDRLALLGRPQAAAIEYRKTMAAGPQDGPMVVARLVRVLLDLGRTAEALDYLNPALSAFPEHAPLCVLAGRAAVLQSRWRQALDALERAAWLNPYDPTVHALTAQAWAALGQEGEAAAAKARQALVDSAGL